MAGRFITFEGGEGAGKSTQARMLADALAARGIAVVQTREPGGTPGAEAIRALLLDNAGEGWDAEAEALLFAAARADHVARLIRPALEAGKWVICDRFIDSSRAYQGGEGALSDDDILALHRVGSRGLMPDLTLVMTLDEDIAAQRLHLRDGADSDRIGGKPAEYHARVAQRFAQFAETEGERIALLDAGGGPEEVHKRVLAVVDERLGGRP